MRIGVLSNSGERFGDNRRLMSEIDALGHEAVLINYQRTASAVIESGRYLFSVNGGGRLSPIEIDAVIPRIGRFTDSGLLALSALTLGKGIPTTGTPEALAIAKTKPLAQLHLDAAGISTPYSVVPNLNAPTKPDPMLKLIEPDPHKPIVIKKNVGSHGSGVGIAAARRYSKSIMSGFGPRIHIQEYLENPENDEEHSDIRLI
ncbi:MAG: ATP-grasp domain-containing protein, partial [Candidatus Saccharimonadales bacterium]